MRLLLQFYFGQAKESRHMKILIIGSKGFIGQHLLQYYQDRGEEVWGADVIVDYAHPENYFLMDASNSDFSTPFAQVSYDLCVNCSGAASVPDSLNNPLRDYYLNTVNVYKILEAIKNHQPRCRFMNLSSAAVYGNPQSLPVKESASPDPLSPYGIHKLQSEQICKEFHAFWNIPSCSLRIFSVYGDGLKKQLFWDLYHKAIKGGPLSLFGTGNESRDFIHVLDLVRTIDLVARHASFEADVINVANGEETTIREAASIFFGFFGSKVEYTFSGESRKGDPVNWRADISRLRSLGYQPAVDMRTGLGNYYKWLTK